MIKMKLTPGRKPDNMETYPNQNIIVEWEKEEIETNPKEDEKKFTQISRRVLSYIMKDLKESELRVWLLLTSRDPNLLWSGGPAFAESWCGMNKSSYYRGWEGLIEKGYLELLGKRKYRFHQLPKEELRTCGEVEYAEPHSTTNIIYVSKAYNVGGTINHGNRKDSSEDAEMDIWQ